MEEEQDGTPEQRAGQARVEGRPRRSRGKEAPQGRLGAGRDGQGGCSAAAGTRCGSALVGCGLGDWACWPGAWRAWVVFPICFLNYHRERKLNIEKTIVFLYMTYIYISKFSGEIILQRGHFSRGKTQTNFFLEIPNKIQI